MYYAEKRNGTLTGFWYADVDLRDTGYKRFRKRFDTKKEAQQYAEHVRVNKCAPAWAGGTGAARAGMSFAEVARACIADGGPNGRWGNGRDRSVLDRLEWIIGRIGAHDIADVTTRLIRAEIVEPLKTLPVLGKHHGRSQNTINNYLTPLKSVLRFAFREDLIDTLPEVPGRKKPPKNPRAPISHDEEDRIVAWLEAQGCPVHAAIVRFLAWSGMRLGELYGRPGDEERTRLRPEQIVHDTVTLRREQTKTDDPRECIVPPAIAQEMRALLGSAQLPDRTQLLKKVQAAAKSVGAKDHVTLHGLRHTLNTRLAKAHVEQKIRMAQLGHRSEQVNNMYTHVDLEDQRRAVLSVWEKRGGAGGVVVKLADHTKTQVSENATDSVDESGSRSSAG